MWYVTGPELLRVTAELQREKMEKHKLQDGLQRLGENDMMKYPMNT